MDISIVKKAPEEAKADVLAVMWTSEGGQPPAASALDKTLGGWLTQTAKEEGFAGKEGETLTLRTEGRLPAAHVVLCGVGRKKDAAAESLRLAAASALQAARKPAGRSLAFALDVPRGTSAAEAAQAAAEGLILGAYRFGAFKTLEPEGPSSAVVLAPSAAFASARRGFVRGRLFAQATNVARDLVNQPAGHLTPLALAKEAERLVAGKTHMSARLMRRAELEKMGAGGLLGVAQGSAHEPVMVHLAYKPRAAKKRVALVGKAVTFDSGGLSLKTAKGMETMKCDMAGAAAVIGAFSALAALKPDVEVHGIFGACENMPSGAALRPGDVVKTMSGKTIEILNTDAEGRVTLADALHFATTLAPDAIVDLATLTGAEMVALGEEITGLMSNRRPLADKVLAAAAQAGEKMWELPLESAYKRELESRVADFKNDTSRWGGCLTAGLLLQEFVAGVPWVHLDIAGPAFAERPFNVYTQSGGTGHGVRTLLEWIERG